MITRRQIRIRVMQALYAYHLQKEEPGTIYDLNLKEFCDDIIASEKEKGEAGDARLLNVLFYKTIENSEDYDTDIKAKAENWELDRIALMDRILMQMAICEMQHFEEIPVKVTINEYLEVAKKYSTPKSSKFINGILDSLYNEYKESGKIKKKGRGLIDHTIPKKN